MPPKGSADAVTPSSSGPVPVAPTTVEAAAAAAATTTESAAAAAVVAAAAYVTADPKSEDRVIANLFGISRASGPLAAAGAAAGRPERVVRRFRRPKPRAVSDGSATPVERGVGRGKVWGLADAVWVLHAGSRRKRGAGRHPGQQGRRVGAADGANRRAGVRTQGGGAGAVASASPPAELPILTGTSLCIACCCHEN